MIKFIVKKIKYSSRRILGKIWKSWSFKKGYFKSLIVIIWCFWKFFILGFLIIIFNIEEEWRSLSFLVYILECFCTFFFLFILSDWYIFLKRKLIIIFIFIIKYIIGSGGEKLKSIFCFLIKDIFRCIYYVLLLLGWS